MTTIPAAMEAWPVKANIRNPERSALLVLDWQGFFVDPSSKAFIPGCLDAAPRLEAAGRLFLKEGNMVLATRHHGACDGADPFLRFYGRTISKNDPLFGLAPPIGAIPGLVVVDKTTYSAFEGGELEEKLLRANVGRLFLAGVQSDKCVLASAFAAFDRGFEVTVISDCSVARDVKSGAAALAIMERACGTVTLLRDLAGGEK